MAPTPSSRSTKEHHPTTPLKTPHSKHRLNFSGIKTPHLPGFRDNFPTEHPVEVIGRIRDHPDRKERLSPALDVAQDGRSVRVRTDIGYRDFSLDGVSISDDEDLAGFYKKFVESRIHGVRLGAKCTIMMYGPTGSGKSHTMFGCAKQPGIVYRALRDILGESDEEKENSDVDDGGFGVGLFVQVAVLEIYNEEIYDLLSGSNAGGTTAGLPKGNTPKVRLEVMGKKAKNATYITGNEAGKLSREVAKVEKRRIVKSTLCNERSSRSHCMIILDVPSVGGRLMLVDMAGSENIEQAGQTGFEAKMQTAKINQGNIALKRVVESIANGDSHVPFRDSKLTMLLQDSFEDDKSKILMILCASPDPKEMHKTISTLEYGAKAKCIVRVAHMPTPKEKITSEESSSVTLGSRIVAMNQFIYKLQMENKMKEKECDEAQKQLLRKEGEVAELMAKLKSMEGRGSAAKEEEINSKVDERTLILRLELEKMEEKMAQQQKELEMLRLRLEEAESQRGKVEKDMPDMVGSRFMKRLSEMCGGEDQGMEKSMELDFGDVPTLHDVKEVENVHRSAVSTNPCLLAMDQESDDIMPSFPQKVCLSTVFEGNEEEEQESEGTEEEEVEKEVVEENRVHDLEYAKDATSRSTRIQNIFRLCGNYRELAQQVKTPTPSKKKPEAGGNQLSPMVTAEEKLAETPNSKEVVHVHDLQPELKRPTSSPYDITVVESPVSDFLHPFSALDLSDNLTSVGSQQSAENFLPEKENNKPRDAEVEGLIDVYVKWETSKEFSGNIIKKLRVLKNSTLSDLREIIETHLNEENSQQPFTFLLLGDRTGAPVVKEKEVAVLVSKLPVCNNQLSGHLACLRPIKKTTQYGNNLPLSPLENKLQLAALNPTEGFSPKVGQNIHHLTGLRA